MLANCNKMKEVCKEIFLEDFFDDTPGDFVTG